MGPESPQFVGSKIPEQDDAGCHHLRQKIGDARLLDQEQHEDIGKPEADNYNDDEARDGLLMRAV